MVYNPGLHGAAVEARMAHYNSTNSLPISVDTFSTTEAEAANEYINAHIALHRLDVIDLHSGVEFDCRRWRIGDFQVCDFSYGECEVEVTVDPCEEHGFFIVIPVAGRVDVSSKDGRFALQPGSAMAFTTPDVANTSFLDSPSFRNINICASDEAIRRFLANEFDLPITRSISFAKHPVFVNHEFRFLLDYMEWFSNRADKEVVSMFNNNSHLSCHLHDLLLGLLVCTFDNNYRELYYSQGSNSAAPVYVRLAEQYMRDNASTAMTVNDIALEVGVAMRTLHKGFQRYRNYSVSEFLRNERLSLARRELATARQRHLSVTDVAYSCGFLHLSKFAVSYQKKYGEKPSDTLRKGN